MNYSHYVQTMKRGLLVFCAGLLLTLTVWPSVVQRRNAHAFNMVMQSMEGLPNRMEILAPIYTGLDTKGRPIEIRAERGLPDAPKPKVIVLETLSAHLGDSNDWIHLTAKTGHYQLENGLIDVSGDIHITKSDGYTAHAEELKFDLKKGLLTSDKPFTSNGPLGDITGQSLEVEQQTKQINVQGGVRMTIHPAP